MNISRLGPFKVSAVGEGTQTLKYIFNLLVHKSSTHKGLDCVKTWLRISHAWAHIKQPDVINAYRDSDTLSP
jgi:hypothetical protein